MPAATVTDAGNVAEPVLLKRFTARPPVPAAALSVTIPVAEDPPSRLVGLTVSETTVGAVIVSVADSGTPFEVAVIVADF